MSLLTRWPGPEVLGAELIRRYEEPHRRYHDAAHLAEVLDRIDELAGEADDIEAVRLAAWFHDAVYQPLRADNEERSAVLAERMLADTDLPPETVAEVARLVRMTAAHDPEPGDRNAAVLSDADLAILAAGPERYAAYAAAVREEYAEVPDEVFRQGRADILRALLHAPSLFRTAPARERWEQAARHNLETELMLLSGADPAP
ncbi:HD domain-containing protein [Actinoallomurus soli]|uniref:HD domain-containing protein n=1 Tax=Actinoallomurus soli TaxID=2952535 RepID=UPI002092C300|nr:metal-dependent phosphohydrolase [Actinoallomurus soli]MCO5973978.1 metal-dependent phosphohydrolase [Actinoallomurus soli]